MAETRQRLIHAARGMFSSRGYAESSMEDIVAEAGVTRGALYHQFGGKPALLEAVIEQIDEEMDERRSEMSQNADSSWGAFVSSIVSYVMMATEPEVQRIVLLDGPAVLGDPSQWRIHRSCIRNTLEQLEALAEEGVLSTKNFDPEATANIISSAALGASNWVANSDDPQTASQRVAASFSALLHGLLDPNQSGMVVEPDANARFTNVKRIER
ncbi:TetR/AcrR family transcriptional regulator [Celeribacter sp.]|uniref:TetR/AcrR family transcriptional regulator n=1 Tax=Celeribacter sp. TaxID=1890673 RepID=UPI003A90FFC5